MKWFKRFRKNRKPESKALENRVVSATKRADAERSTALCKNDYWIRLAQGTTILANKGDYFPIKCSLLITNWVNHPSTLRFFILQGQLHHSSSASSVVYSPAINIPNPKYRLELKIRVNIALQSERDLSLQATDASTDQHLPTASNPISVHDPDSLDENSLESNCLIWEKWMENRYQLVLGNRFEVTRLAEGGMGVVYIAFDRENKICQRPFSQSYPFVIKSLKPEIADDPAAIELLDEEAKYLTSIQPHPNVVSLLDVLKIGKETLIAMDWYIDVGHYIYSGNSLQARLDTSISLAEILEWSIGFCNGMRCARMQGMIAHRDIKPANLLVDPLGSLRIADFGIALWKSMSRIESIDAMYSLPEDRIGTSVTHTEKGSIAGTIGYIPPEILEGEEATELSDIYSFGIVLWQLWMGTASLPYSIPSDVPVVETLSYIYKKQKEARFNIKGGALKSIIENCLRPDPKYRISGVDELEDRLQEVFKATKKSAGKSKTDEVIVVGILIPMELEERIGERQWGKIIRKCFFELEAGLSMRMSWKGSRPQQWGYYFLEKFFMEHGYIGSHEDLIEGVGNIIEEVADIHLKDFRIRFEDLGIECPAMLLMLVRNSAWAAPNERWIYRSIGAKHVIAVGK